jgi:hypothetical protein
MKVSGLRRLACLGLLLVTQAWAQEQTCSHTAGWEPTREELQRILSDHEQWVQKWKAEKFAQEWPVRHPEGRANLCNADLSYAGLSKADLIYANLNNANLSGADLNNANLLGANLSNANLGGAQLNNTKLNGAQLDNADLSGPT